LKNTVVFQVPSESVTFYETDESRHDVLIDFPDPRVQRVFNDHGLLQRRYGPELARCISRRMSLLKAATRLALIPRDPPILLSEVRGSPKTFTVSLSPPRKLRFAAPDAPITPAGAMDLDSVVGIMIVGIDCEPNASAKD
jgi:hypothetical protein